MYRVFVPLNGDRELLDVASFDKLDEAAKLVRTLKTNWPHKYVVLDPQGKNVELSE